MIWFSYPANSGAAYSPPWVSHWLKPFSELAACRPEVAYSCLICGNTALAWARVGDEVLSLVARIVSSSCIMVNPELELRASVLRIRTGPARFPALSFCHVVLFVAWSSRKVLMSNS